MLWIKIGEGRYYGGASGAPVTYNLPIQDWGLQVKDILGAVVVTGRGTSNAKVRLRFDQGAVDDPNMLVDATSGGVDVIGSSGSPVSVPTVLPGTLKGAATSGGWLPYLRFQLIVSGTASDEWVEVKIFCGGKAF